MARGWSVIDHRGACSSDIDRGFYDPFMCAASLQHVATEILRRVGARERTTCRSRVYTHPEEVTDVLACSAQSAPIETSTGVDERVRDSSCTGESLYRLDMGKVQELRRELVNAPGGCDNDVEDLDTVRAGGAWNQWEIKQ